MIYGIGTDLVRVARLEEGLARFGEPLARRILTAAEWNEFCYDRRPAHFLAKRFAAKEAVVKALGTGFRGGMKLSDIGVTHDGAGKPGLSYSGAAAVMMRQCAITASHISLSDEREYALAFVVLLTE